MALALDFSAAVRAHLLIPRCRFTTLGAIEYGHFASRAIRQVQRLYLLITIRTMQMLFLLLVLFHDFLSS
jgi:hypothetical protein